MNAPGDDTTDSRPVLRRLIRPWEYRHAHAVGSARFVAGGFQLGIGVVLLGLGRRSETEQDRRKCYRWAAWFLGMSALQISGGVMDMAVARTAPPRP
jgi:hypothetical protein